MRLYETNPGFGNHDINLKGIQYEINSNAAYGDHVKNTYSICNTSAAHTYGNVLGTVEKYILDQFPPDTFKTITATTALASRQLRHTPKQISKLSYPTFIVSPRIDFGQDDNRFLGNTLINSRYNNIYSQWGDGSLLQLAYDKVRQLDIRGHYNRAVLYLDIVLGFQTFVEQTNWMGYIHNMIPLLHNFFIKAPLELYIPMEFCKVISGLVDIPTHDENGSVYDFMSYMNSIWYNPITYKMKGSSNTDEFFMYYITDIDTVVQDPQAQAPAKDGQIKRNFDITFTVRCEFNTIGYFLLNSPVLKHPTKIMATESDAIIPIFSDQINLKDFQLPVGWTILGFPIFKLGKGENSISISPMMNQSLNTVLDYHLKHGIPISRFLQIQFRENGSILSDESFHIDWRAQKLILKYPNTHRTYRLLITVNGDYINNLIKDIYNLE